MSQNTAVGSTVTLNINDNDIEVPSGITLIQACELAGVEIPRFCYHDRLEIAGNCRMCLVEMERAPKPVASCAMPVGEGMVVKTNTEQVKKAREGVMEFLLANHPLDCPICDQGGECDLQDQAMAYGRGKSDFLENKRSVKEKYMGPLIKTTMTRCIHCTRCVRFAEDVAVVPALGAVGRGESMEITTLEKTVASELSGNVIDLCPVGALTSRPYAFTARPWELRKTESIDVMDALGSSIRIDAKGDKVLRILPRLNEDINEEWLSDKSRYACDGLSVQRLDRPYIKQNGSLQAVDWDTALNAVIDKLQNTKNDKIGFISGGMIDMETQFSTRKWLDSLGIHNRDSQPAGYQTPKHLSHYLFNSEISGLEETDAIVIIGANPRLDAPVLNARIRRQAVKRKVPVAVVGTAVDLTYPYVHLGDDLSAAKEALDNAEKPMVLIGSDVFMRNDVAAVLKFAQENTIKNNWNGVNILHKNAAQVGGYVTGYFPHETGMGKGTTDIINDCDVVYLQGYDEADVAKLKDKFVIYQGHHGDASARVADIILPGAAYTEKTASYMNTEGRLQQAQQATFPPLEAKEDWKIIRVLSELSGKALPYNTYQQLIMAMTAELDLPTYGACIKPNWQTIEGAGTLSTASFETTETNFYQTDPISRASKTMAECLRALEKDDAALAA